MKQRRKRDRDAAQQAPIIIEAELVEPEAGTLVVAEAARGRPRPERPSLALCPSCGGPGLLCGGEDLCIGSAPEGDQRWLTAVRALYAGLLLGTTEAALWGGALIRLARRVGAGAPPDRILSVLDAATDPRCEVSPRDATLMALKVLTTRDLDAAFELQCALGRAQASWLGRIWHIADQAVRALPTDGARFPLMATACDGCARKAPSMFAEIVPADTYDGAIRCPACDAVPRHPFPWVKIGEPHPVGRCTRGATNVCLVHGQALDADGLCPEGRGVLERAVTEQRTPGPKDPVFLDAMARARRLWIEGGGLVRAVVTSEACGPTFAALAAANPETAKVLERMAGAPLDVTTADPAVVAQVTKHGSLSGVVADGIAALKTVLTAGGFAEEPGPRIKRLATPRRRRRAQRGQ